MGQNVKALVWGVKLDNKLYTALHDSSEEVLWYHADLFKENERVEWGEEVFGFAFACEMDEYGEDGLDSVSINDIGVKYIGSISKAKKLWKRLSRWLESNGHAGILPKPEIWLTTVERA